MPKTHSQARFWSLTEICFRKCQQTRLTWSGSNKALSLSLKRHSHDTVVAETFISAEAERSPVRFHLHKGRTLSLRKWLKPIVVAICALTDLTKEALPSSLQIEAFYVSTFYTRDFHLVLSPWTLSIFYVVARMWPLHCCAQGRSQDFSKGGLHLWKQEA